MYKSYIICATPRSGSTLLCGLLKDTKVAGRPDSFYRSVSTSLWADHWGLPEQSKCSEHDFQAAFLECATLEGAGNTGVFGMRLMKENVEDLSNRLKVLFPNEPNDKARIEKAFGQTLFIHLSRKDKIAQAVSFVKATQSGLWHVAADGSELERLTPPAEPKYDPLLIGRAVKGFEAFEFGWKNWFLEQQIDSVIVTYESLSINPKAVLASLLEKLDLDTRLSCRVSPGVSRLADDINQDWIQRYRAEITAEP